MKFVHLSRTHRLIVMLLKFQNVGLRDFGNDQPYEFVRGQIRTNKLARLRVEVDFHNLPTLGPAHSVVSVGQRDLARAVNHATPFPLGKIVVDTR